jgi:hypothetical protein
MEQLAVIVKQSLNEYDDTDVVLESYGLSYIFALNEDESTNMFQKFKEPLAKTLTKVKNKFGDKPCKFISDVVKKASAKGRKTLYGVLTAVTLLSGTLSANAITNQQFDDSLRNSMVTSTVNMTHARGIQSGAELEAVKKHASADFVNILYALDDDTNNRYAASGVGCSDSESEAKKLAQEDAEKTVKQLYGEDAISKYGLQFKTIKNQSYINREIKGGQQTVTSYYTVIVVAYQAVH